MVTVALLALALVLGPVAAGVRARIAFRRAGSTFRCKVRWPDRGTATAPAKWSRRAAPARWVHDVLLVQRGILRSRIDVLAVRGPDRATRTTSRFEVTGLRARPAVLALRLDDAETVELASREGDLTALVGPFVAAALPVLPPAASEPPHRAT